MRVYHDFFLGTRIQINVSWYFSFFSLVYKSDPRSILPEESYVNKDLDGIPIKVLRGKATHPIAQALASSLKGVFDALEKKYLKEFLFIIYLNQESN